MAKDDDEGGAKRVPGVKVKVLRAGIKKYEDLAEEARSIMSAAMTKVKGIRDKQRDAIEETVSQAGVTKKALKVHLKERELLAKVSKLSADMEAEDSLSLDQIKEKLGVLADTPLGKAATGEGDAEAADGKVTAFRPSAAGDAHIAKQLAKGQQAAGTA